MAGAKKRTVLHTYIHTVPAHTVRLPVVVGVGQGLCLEQSGIIIGCAIGGITVVDVGVGVAVNGWTINTTTAVTM